MQPTQCLKITDPIYPQLQPVYILELFGTYAICNIIHTAARCCQC